MVVQLLRLMRLDFVAPLNGAHLAGSPARRAMQWRKLEGLGAGKGIPDILIFTPPPAFPDARGVAVEMKSPDGKAPTSEQLGWHRRLEAIGWVVILAYGFDEARRDLRACGYERRAS